MSRSTDLAGQRFGRWTVLRRVPNRGWSTRWECRCDCGSERVVGGWDLIRTDGRQSRSCGCTKGLVHGHGRRGDLTYQSWRDMRRRCTDQRCQAFRNYGGRGITVCERWQSFVNFLADMGVRPSKAHTLDRIDNDRGYEPGNCRWATQAVQKRNTRSNHLITASDVTLTITDWAARLGCSTQCVLHRIRRGWPPEKAVSVPVSPTNHRRKGATP